MKNNTSVIKQTEKHVLGNYRRFPVALVRGKGAWVWDRSGKKYLDFVAGIAVDNLGHCHPDIVKALRDQAGRLLHVSNIYHIEPQSELAHQLTRQCFANKVFFCNSGTEANEAAIKLARKFYQDRGESKRFQIISTLDSFHGRTLGSLGATGQKKMQKGFGPMLPGFKYVPFDDLKAVKQAISDKTCAVMVEPIQGETGVNMPSSSYLKRLRRLCNEHDLLLILDEVQTGMGRTGHLFAHQDAGIKPDIMTLAKGLGGGVPIGAMLTTDMIATAFTPGTHGSTFGGNPLVCAAGLAAIKKIGTKAFLKQVQSRGAFFMDRLKKLAKKQPAIQRIRGKGLIIGVDLSLPTPDIAKQCLENGLLVNAIAPNTLRFIPPLIVTRKEIEHGLKIIEKSIEAIAAQSDAD